MTIEVLPLDGTTFPTPVKRQAGRPALAREQRRSERMIVTVSPLERDRYAAEADRRSMRITDIFRQSIEFFLAHHPEGDPGIKDAGGQEYLNAG